MQGLFRYVIKQVFGQITDSEVSYRQVSGGCINNTAIFEFDNQFHFIKWNTKIDDLFEKEVGGLELLRQVNGLRVPRVLSYGSYGDVDYLCLEYVDKCTDTSIFWENFGRKLAELHQNKSEDFGLDYDNHIGRLPQYNTQNTDWVSFFIEQRLLPQLEIARDHGLIDGVLISQFEKLFLVLDSLIPKESPSLLHGDLWSGNFLCTENQEPCVFDPATYYGHREAELAFTKMFGGFEDQFYRSYQESLPLQPEYEKRVELFNLYPLLVHLNLFGTSYLGPIRQTLKRFV